MTSDHDSGDNTRDLVGRQLGRYTCLREIGAGGMAVLYLAQRTGAKGFTKRFALKRIKPKYAADQNFTRMFMREAKLSATLDHPNIAQVVDFGQDGREHFIVMEYVHGLDLRRLIRASPENILPLECALSVATRVCAALHYAHEKRDAEGKHQALVHRDVSATNVLLSMDGAVKLTDFGIAKGFAADGTGTSSSMLVGKPGYMSPEQVRCESLDRRSDVFCIGILLYEMTTGRRCFYGDSVFAVLNATQRAQYVTPSQRLPDYPPALEAIIAKTLQADADARYASARDLQLALEDFALDHRIRTSDAVLGDYITSLDLDVEDPDTWTSTPPISGTSMRESGGTAFMLSGESDPIVDAGEPETVAPSRGKSTPWLLGAGLGLVALAGLGIAMRGTGEDPAPTRNPVASTPAEADVSKPEVAKPDVAPSPVVAAQPDEPEPEPEPEPVLEPEPSAVAQPDKPTKKKRRRRASKKKPSKKSGSALEQLLPPSRRKG